MNTEFCDKIFGNLFDNKIVFHERITLFCTVVECTVINNRLNLKLKVIEPVIEIPDYANPMYQMLKSKDYFEVGTNMDVIKFLELDKQKLSAPYCSFSIWANYETVKKVTKLKAEGKEKEIAAILWA